MTVNAQIIAGKSGKDYIFFHLVHVLYDHSEVALEDRYYVADRE
jgi:hypothetical protein